jgi:peptide deformylase
MREVCDRYQGVGLSAVQVGIPWRLCLVNFPHPCRYLVNCEYKPTSETKEKGIEGCLSLIAEDGNFRRFEVERYKKINVTGYELIDDIELKLISIDIILEGWNAIIVQHELDHSEWPGKNPTLISEIGVELDIWQKGTQYAYRQSC